MNYLFEKNINMPICAVIDNKYIDYLTGEVLNLNIDNNYIIRKLDFKIYFITDKNTSKFVAYNYFINGVSNYLDFYKQPIKDTNYIKNKIIKREYVQELIWGEKCE